MESVCCKSDYQLLKGDCLELMKDIPDGSVDMVIVDPPYGIDFQSQRVTKNKRKPKIANDRKPFVWWCYDAVRMLKDGGCLLCFTRWDVQQVFIDMIENAGMLVKSEIIWDKTWHGAGDIRASFAPMHENIIFAVKGGFCFPNKRPKDVITIAKVAPAKLLHPNEKPVALLEKLIEDCSTKGSTVVDMFMGSGSTGVAAMNTGRKFIGMELDDTYFDIAKQRIEDAAFCLQ